jgi:hypothetical protein
MTKLILSLVLLVSAICSGAFAMGFNGDVSVSEPNQLIVDVGSGESTMITLERKSMLINNKLASAIGRSYPQSYTLSSYREGTNGYISPSGLKRLTG